MAGELVFASAKVIMFQNRAKPDDPRGDPLLVKEVTVYGDIKGDDIKYRLLARFLKDQIAAGAPPPWVPAAPRGAAAPAGSPAVELEAILAGDVKIVMGEPERIPD